MKINLASAQKTMQRLIGGNPKLIRSLDEIDYPEAIESFVYVLIRDTLFEHGATFFAADRLATVNTGKATQRLVAAVKEFNQRGK